MCSLLLLQYCLVRIGGEASAHVPTSRVSKVNLKCWAVTNSGYRAPLSFSLCFSLLPLFVVLLSQCHLTYLLLYFFVLVEASKHLGQLCFNHLLSECITALTETWTELTAEQIDTGSDWVHFVQMFCSFEQNVTNDKNLQKFLMKQTVIEAIRCMFAMPSGYRTTASHINLCTV